MYEMHKAYFKYREQKREKERIHCSHSCKFFNEWCPQCGHLPTITYVPFYFFYQNDTYVLLHQFRKKSQKTPKREIEKAKAERNDYLRRKETAKL